MNLIPGVSVICPVYNQEKYIRKCIDSILAQIVNYPIEIIIHDDASDDGTIGIIEEYRKLYPNIVKAVYEEENQFSRNMDFFSKIVTNVANMKYIAHCEGDDYWIDRTKLQKQFDAMEAHPECDMCACRAVMVSADEKNELGEIRPRNSDGFLPIESVISGGGNYIASAGIFFRKTMFDHMMEFEKIRSLDYSHQIKGALRGGIYYFDTPMVAYRRYSQGSVTSNITTDGVLMDLQCNQEKKILKTFDEETGGKYHYTVLNRLKDYDISCYDQLIANENEIIESLNSYSGHIYIWGMGVRGCALEKFCNEKGIALEGVCDVLNNHVGETTKYGNAFVHTDFALRDAGVIMASVTGAYNSLKNSFGGMLMNMQKYMPRI